MLDCHQYMEVEDLRLRVRELEAKVQNLRLSRRVLMNILEASEKGKRRETETLERINDRLRRDNRRYAQRLMEQNRRILDLQEQLQQVGGKEIAGYSLPPEGNTIGEESGQGMALL